MRVHRIPLFILSLFLAIPVAFAASAWPADSGTTIAEKGDTLSDDYEASGAAYHRGIDAILTVHDEGVVSAIDAEQGAWTESWSVGGYDLEGVAVRDHEDSVIYLLVEHPDTILAFDLDTGALTGDSWDLTGLFSTSDRQGPEALTFIDGYAVVGLQEDATIHFLELEDGGSVNWVRSMDSYYSSDVSGLHYNHSNDRLYVLHDGSNRIVEMTKYGYVLDRYETPGENDEEGIVLYGSCQVRKHKDTGQLFLADDEDGTVIRYDGFPMNCPKYHGEIDDYEYDSDYQVLRVFYSNGSVQEVELEEVFGELTSDDELNFWFPKGKKHRNLVVEYDETRYVLSRGKLHAVSSRSEKEHTCND